MESTDAFGISDASLDRKLLIATQGSPFKDSITTVVLNRYKDSSVIVKVIDVKALADTDATHFDAILIQHRWEANAPAESVQSFMDKNLGIKNKIIMLTTSWNGLEKMENVDAITGASIVRDVPLIADRIFRRLDGLLKYKN